jgi:long-chain-fatty-acid--[acyl-carrier-protein] ligase
MNFVYLLAATLLTGFGMGFVKFYALGYLANQVYTPDQKDWIIQVVGALLTLGPVIVYVVSGPLASSRKKRVVMACSAFVICLLLLFGYFTAWMGSWWFYIVALGILMGLFNAGKMASVPLEARRSGRTSFAVNGGLSIVFLVGMLVGIPMGAYFVGAAPGTGFVILFSAFLLGSVFGGLCVFPQEHLLPFKTCVREVKSDSLHLFKELWPYLLSSPAMWGLGSAISLAITAYAELTHLGTDVQCSYMSLFAAVGIITGNFVSPFLVAFRYMLAILSGLFVAVIVGLIPLVVSFLDPSTVVAENGTGYYTISILLGCIGVCFGILTNFIDSEYLDCVAKENLEGTGAALQSAMISFFTFFLGGFVGASILFKWMTLNTQFYWLCGLTLISLIPIMVLASGSDSLKYSIGYVFSPFARFALALRYKIHVKGLKDIKGTENLLFLPNHPAEIDPFIVSVLLFKKFRPRPVALDTFTRDPIAGKLLSLSDAIPVPETSTGMSSYKEKKIHKAMAESAACLRQGRNVLMYPAGMLIREGQTRIMGASGLKSILEENPNQDVVLVRTTGLWGSSFSTALTAGITPDLGKTVLSAIKKLLFNFILFCPRRRVSVEFSCNPSDFPRGAERQELNQWLEDWYNSGRDNKEPLNLVRNYFWSSETPVPKEEGKEKETLDLSGVSESVKLGVKEELSAMTKMDSDSILPEMRLGEDLGLDSLERAEIPVWLNERFEVYDVELAELTTVGSVMVLAAGSSTGASGAEFMDRVRTPENWQDSGNRSQVMIPEGNTIPELFLKNCDRMGSAVAVGDTMTGILDWKKLKLVVLLMADAISKMPGDRVGVLLPASVGATLISLACQLAGKIPVMINWTLGRKNLHHVRDVGNFEVIISSERFLDRLGRIDLGDLDENLVLLEDVRRGLGIKEKTLAYLRSFKSASSLMSLFKVDKRNADDPAVLLFTSGSETAPKGVMLSHKNIISNIRGYLPVIGLNSDDVLYGILPPFHSFGFAIGTILPAISGLKVAYHPNPTESRKLARGIASWNITICCGTPTFLNGILKASRKEYLEKLRFLVSGAEKAPDALFERLESIAPHVELIEGYGVTECSPVVCLNYPGMPHNGVGRSTPGTEIIAVNPDTYEPVNTGERGLILVRGDNVFSGYMGDDVPDPFIEVNDLDWYVTGDLGSLDPEGNLVLSGRLKRFVKKGGEMISLPSMEDVLNCRWPIEEDGPVVAIEACELDGRKPEICLFTVKDILLAEANKVLREAGFSNIARLTRVHKLDQIPLLGTGKIDYRNLKGLLLRQLN